ncbi:hypothetical protein, partial [Chroococcidiopsis sp.]|uniref:hypothetical protein n=1 Tax=Chroococcidiopsis sp. TaxID=3088168 RepID=UPI003F2C7BC1
MSKLRKNVDVTSENLDYYNDNVFKYWCGPTLPEGDPHYNEVIEQIERVFQSRNIIAECINRQKNALVGKKAHWYIADKAGNRLKDDSASVAELLLNRWIDKQYALSRSHENSLSNAIAEATKNMLVAGKGYLRLWSPKRFRNSPDLITRVALHSPHPDSVVINRDVDGFIDSIEYQYSANDLKRTEIQRIDELTNLTIFTTLNEQEQEIEEETLAIDLGGRFSIFEMAAPSLITSSIKSAQNAINFVLTMMVRSAEVGGFRERLILGAQPPGHWDEDGLFTPDSDFTIGPGRTSFIQGVPLTDEIGGLKGYTNPSVNYVEPVSPQTFIDT